MIIEAAIFSACVVGFAAGSVAYVYNVRGSVRYASFSEYVRKGWPIFAPLNCFLYLLTQRRAKRAIMDLDEFPELAELAANWQTIREEAVALYEQGSFDSIGKPDSPAYYDVGFRTFYKYGWSKFYLKWYGYTHESARRFCPKTVDILSRTRCVNGAMFSILPSGSKLTRHLDPVACSLRYHLGLQTPESDDCYINIDGERYSWRNGEALLFDETYLHFAHNDADNYRLILMCDVERPMNLLGKLANLPFKLLMKFTVVPNADGDRRGLANAIFSTVAPLLKRSKALKARNRRLYLLLKHSFNGLLLLLLLAALGGMFAGAWYLIGG